MCEVSVAATEQCLPVVRAAMRHWLAGLTWPDDPAEDIVLAVHEAVSNAVEHAYPSPDHDPDEASNSAGNVVCVRAVVKTDPPTTAWKAHLSATATGRGGDRRVQVSVADHGRWQPDRHDRTDPARPRGRGLTMMEALMAEMTITAGVGTGTEVVLLSEAVSLQPAVGVRPAHPHGW